MDGNKLNHKDVNYIDTVLETISYPLNTLFYNLGMTPNMVTFLSLVVALFGAYLLYKNYYLAWAFCWMISYLLDVADGQMARRYNMVSEGGDYFDHISDNIKMIVLLIVLFFKMPFRSFLLFLLVGIIPMALMIIISLGCQQKIYERENPEEKEKETLDKLEWFCPFPESTQKAITRWFGVAPAMMYIMIIVLLFLI
mgnify:CR=1 FL=1